MTARERLAQYLARAHHHILKFPKVTKMSFELDPDCGAELLNIYPTWAKKLQWDIDNACFHLLATKDEMEQAMQAVDEQ